MLTVIEDERADLVEDQCEVIRLELSGFHDSGGRLREIEETVHENRLSHKRKGVGVSWKFSRKFA